MTGAGYTRNGVDPLHAVWRTLGNHSARLAMLEKARGKGLKLPWASIAIYGGMGLLSLLGITIPEKVATFLKLLAH